MNKPGDKKEMIRVLIVDDIPETRENLKKLLAFETDIEVVGMAATGREGIDLAREKKPDVILMDINMPDIDGIQATELISQSVPNAGVIMMSVQHEQEYFRRAMQAGARDFLAKPVAGDELYSTIRRIYTTRPKLVMVDNGDGGGGGGGGGGVSRRPGQEGKVIVVYSPQGGAGKTTVATNTAAALLRENIKVLLIDADLQFGDVGVFLNLVAQNTIMKLVPTAMEDDLDVDLVNNVLIKHDIGLKVLLGPPTIQDAEEVPVEVVLKLVTKLRLLFDFIVVDTGSPINDLNLGLFDLADRIVLVTLPTLPALKNTRATLNVMDALKYPEEKVQLVFNRVNAEYERTKIAPPVAALESRLKRKALLSIPTDERKVFKALTQGTPVFAGKDRNTSPAKEYLALADALYNSLMVTEEEPEVAAPQANKSSSRLLRLLGS